MDPEENKKPAGNPTPDPTNNQNTAKVKPSGIKVIGEQPVTILNLDYSKTSPSGNLGQQNAIAKQPGSTQDGTIPEV